MAIELTEQQRQALAQSKQTLPTMVDPISNTTYVLVRAELYERLKELVEKNGEIQAVREMYRTSGMS